MYLRAKEKNTVTLPYIAQRKYAFLEEIKEMSKTKKLPSRKKTSLELLHQRLGHRSTRSFLYRNTANVWEDIELRIYLDYFCITFQMSSTNKKEGSKNQLKPKSPFKWVFSEIIPSAAPKSLTSDKTFSNYLLIIYAYSNTPKLYGMVKITTE